ncbi:hypothetical protein ABEB36_001014 [Hypothenemus hampei]|uniref:G patch domain-containing protein n=1 Tax=Hypothenemus hampei TaxID=57062 RepID=A0ABD1FD76_HYPHA
MDEFEDNNEHFCFYGDPLDPYDEDSVPRKRPISVEEQIATDAQGRRRFHGAFTGGFSAGFFNTVGSLEGWNPTDFKSSRHEKSTILSQKPEDFMDEEDMGEDGFAPHVVRATKDYNISKKRKKQMFTDGPIPGEPVLHNILSSGNETIGYMLLKSLRIQSKKVEQQQEKTYGCQMPRLDELQDFKDLNHFEMPTIYKQFLAKPKSETFGLGYIGLSEIIAPLEVKSQLKITDSNNKKLSIRGQAFGVGAFEEDDDDIYMKEDMSNYDFELAGEKEAIQTKKDETKLVLGLFERSKGTPLLKQGKQYSLPTIPHSFTGKHKVKRSRFEPVIEELAQSTSGKINPLIRAKYLGEEEVKEENITASKSLNETKNKNDNDKPQEPVKDNLNAYLSDRFVSSSKEENVNDILEKVDKSESIHGTSEMRAAVKMKMFGPLTRITTDWMPSSLLCKRFNVQQPHVDCSEKTKTRTKNIIFEYQKHLEEQQELQPGLVEQKEKIEIKTEEPETVTEEVPSDLKELLSTTSSQREHDLNEKLNLEEHQDLFRAIFLSSDSESDREKTSENSEDESRKEEFKDSILSEQMLLPIIKPLKEGLLSGINLSDINKAQQGEESEKKLPQNQKEEEEEKDRYGPKMPNKCSNIQTPAVIHVDTDSECEWVEKDGKSAKKRKEKKVKKHKSKHKKHKHKKK